MRALMILTAGAVAAGLAASPALARPPAHAKGGGDTFGSQVRALAQGERDPGEGAGIGPTVSRMVHERNDARAAARSSEALFVEPESKPRGRGRKSR